MRVKIFSHENIETLETKVNEFLTTLTTADVKHVNTAEGETETIITVWYDDLGLLPDAAAERAGSLKEAGVKDRAQD